MSFVLVSADCSCCKAEGIEHIYSLLKDDGWIRINEDADSDTSIWLGSLAKDIPDDEAMVQAKNKFYSRFNPNCKPTLVLHSSIREKNIASVAG